MLLVAKQPELTEKKKVGSGNFFCLAEFGGLPGKAARA